MLETIRQLVINSIALTREDKTHLLENLPQLSEKKQQLLLAELQTLAAQERADLNALPPETAVRVEQAVHAAHHRALAQAEAQEKTREQADLRACLAAIQDA